MTASAQPPRLQPSREEVMLVGDHLQACFTAPMDGTFRSLLRVLDQQAAAALGKKPASKEGG